MKEESSDRPFSSQRGSSSRSRRDSSRHVDRQKQYRWILKQDSSFILHNHPVARRLQKYSLTNFQPVPEAVAGDNALQPTVPEPEKQRPNYFTTGLQSQPPIAAGNKDGLKDVIFTSSGQMVVQSGGISAHSAQAVLQPGQKYTEPSDAAAPTGAWRMFHFAPGSQRPEGVPLETKSCYRLGRASEVVDVTQPHQTCSSIHAAIQFRKKPMATGGFTVEPYIIDLGSTNHTFIKEGEGKRLQVDKLKFYQILDKDMQQFGEYKGEYLFVKTQK